MPWDVTAILEQIQTFANKFEEAVVQEAKWEDMSPVA